MSKKAVIAKLPVQEGKRDDLVAIFGPVLDQVNSEVGTEMYVLHFDDSDDNVVWAYELYSDDEALASHGGSDAMATLIGQIGPLLGGVPEMITLTPTGGKGL